MDATGSTIRGSTNSGSAEKGELKFKDNIDYDFVEACIVRVGEMLEASLKKEQQQPRQNSE